MLEEAEDLEKLETWVVVAWGAESLELVTEDVRRVTLNLLLRQPSTLPRLEGLLKMPIPEMPWAREIREELRRICNQARAELSPLEPPPPYVSVRPADTYLLISDTTFFAAVHRFTPNHSFSFLSQETTLLEFVYWISCLRGLMSGEWMTL